MLESQEALLESQIPLFMTKVSILPVCQPQYIEDRVIRLRDLQASKNMSLTLPDMNLSADDVLLRGRFFSKTLRDGLNIHCSDSIEEQAFTSCSHQDAGLSCIFFLQGRVDLKVGSRAFSLDAHHGGKIEAAGLVRREVEPFQRTTRQAQAVKHLVVTASQQWLQGSGYEAGFEKTLSKQFKCTNMAFGQWQANKHLTALIQDVMIPNVIHPQLLNLQLESRSIDIISETLSGLFSHGERPPIQKLTKHDQVRLQRACDYILHDPSQAFSVDGVAKQAGMSVSSLQRLFKRVYGSSVFEYIRYVRLNKAMNLLKSGEFNVDQVSYYVGYNTPANFSTAFKRHFGVTPSQAMGS